MGEAAGRRTRSGGYLSERALGGLATYKYKSGGLTWLDHLHTPMWNAMVELLPKWLAPNLITLVGLMWVVTAHVLATLYMPTYQEDCPVWLYYFAAAAVVVYVNLDCIDGKQARRTGSSSPLGQLFDHGCDAVSLHLLLDTVRTSINLSSTWGAVVMELAIMTPWMLAHWEEYHTGVMLYGNGLFGVLEGNYALVVIHLVSAALGRNVWAMQVPLPFALPAALDGIDTLGNLALIGVAAMAVVSALGQLYRVLVFSPASLPPQEVGHKQLGQGAAFLHLTYIFLLIGLGYVYLTTLEPAVSDAAISDWAAWRGEGGLQGLLDAGRDAAVALHTRVVGATWGLVYALVATQLILSHVCKEGFTPSTWALGLLALGCANNRLAVAPPPLLDALLLAVTVVGYTHFVTTCIRQICDYLGIACLTIKKGAPARKAN